MQHIQQILYKSKITVFQGLSVVRSMSSQTTLDQDEPPHLDASLVRQLEQIARNHGGMVPLHGRLFAQWLHYVLLWDTWLKLLDFFVFLGSGSKRYKEIRF